MSEYQEKRGNWAGRSPVEIKRGFAMFYKINLTIRKQYYNLLSRAMNSEMYILSFLDRLLDRDMDNSPCVDRIMTSILLLLLHHVTKACAF